MSAPHYDAVVVGSGFGGSVSAYRYREGGMNVCLLERGKRYKPGDFPRSPKGLAQNVWDPDHQLYGMFQVWAFHHIEALVSSALGGGSIIYANVLLEKPPGTFAEWPLEHKNLVDHYEEVRRVIQPQTYPHEFAPYNEVRKANAFADAAAKLPDAKFSFPPLAITFANQGAAPVPGEPIAGSPGRHTCRLCGECNAGCNFGSKNTLDFNYLKRFEDHPGEKIRTLCEVKSFGPRDEGGFYVKYRQYVPETGAVEHLEVTADRLTISAGSLGSTYLLLRNRDNFRNLPLPARLGTQWCGNGDFLGSLKNAASDLNPEHGPVITSALEYDGGRYYIEDGGYPPFVEWLEEGMGGMKLARRVMHTLEWWLKRRLTDRSVSDVSRQISKLIDDGKSSSRTLPLCGMGEDKPDGKLTLEDKRLQNSWSTNTSKDYYEDIEGSMKELAKAIGAEFSPATLLKLDKLVTSHPVGGCPMGTSADDGVVDEFGRVFGVPRLSIVDGSILPGPVGPNPSLTIAAIADRAATFTLANW